MAVSWSQQGLVYYALDTATSRPLCVVHKVAGRWYISATLGHALQTPGLTLGAAQAAVVAAEAAGVFPGGGVVDEATVRAALAAAAAAIAVNNQKLTGVADGVDPTDAATKGQVDTVAGVASGAAAAAAAAQDTANTGVVDAATAQAAAEVAQSAAETAQSVAMGYADTQDAGVLAAAQAFAQALIGYKGIADLDALKALDPNELSDKASYYVESTAQVFSWDAESEAAVDLGPPALVVQANAGGVGRHIALTAESAAALLTRILAAQAAAIAAAAADATSKANAAQANAEATAAADATSKANTAQANAEATAAADATAKADAAEAASQPVNDGLTSLAALTPAGNALKVLRVNAAETGFELATPAAGTPYAGTPAPVAATGDDGTSDDYARGDHVHAVSLDQAILDLYPTVWWDARVAYAHCGSGGAVALWRDRSGNDYPLTQATSGNRPTAQLSGSTPVVRFDGSNDWLSTAVAPALGGTQGVTVVAVAENTMATNAFSVIVEPSSAAWGGTAWFRLMGSDGTTGAFASNHTGSAGGCYRRTDAYTGLHTVISRHDKATGTAADELKLYIDGAEPSYVASTSNNNTDAFSDWLLQIGARNDGSAPFKGDVAHLLIFPYALSTGQVATLHAALAAIAGL